jgi:HlyD family secretion protein
VLSISPLVDALRGAVEVKFALPQVPAFLREDMTLSVEVETGRRDRTLVLPLDALRGDGGAGTSTVWVETEGRVRARAVRTGLRTVDAVEVLQGLSAGDTVLVGASPLPGERVRGDTAAGLRLAAGKSSGDNLGSTVSNMMGR